MLKQQGIMCSGIIVRVSSLEAESSIYALSATGLFLSFIYCDILYVKSLQGTILARKR